MSANDLPPPPDDRDELLEVVGPQRARIYHAVRQILDDMEDVAPWKDLYYPPTEIAVFLRLQQAMLRLIEEIPYRTSALSVEILSTSFQDLLRSLPGAALDDSTRGVITHLLDAEAAAAASRSARQVAIDAIAGIPGAVLAEPLKLLAQWLIDRHAEAPSIVLTGEAFEEAIASFPEEILDPSMKEILGNLQFYFDGIQMMASGDIEKLAGRVHLFESTASGELTAEDRVFTCEIAADLKGKLTSAMMGAAANLVTEGRWNGAEAEPVLFPEKAAEFERNEQLVETLREVLDSIRRLPEDVPLVQLVATWKENRRIDRYALATLYGFLGSLGKLMKESSRRALYSGDYHQVQMRESRLSQRVNELNMLHNKTWEVVQEDDPSIQDCYPRMVDRAIELAAVVDVEILKELIGGEMVKVLLEIVSIEGVRRKEQDVRLGQDQSADYTTPASIRLRGKVPERLQGLIPLLYDEDLQTFLELLLGSVLKRASFSIKKRQEEDEATEAPPPTEELEIEELEADAVEILDVGPPAAAIAAGDDNAAKLAELERLRGQLRDFLSPTNAHRKSFDLVHRLLTQKGMVPPSMLQSILPFLEALTDVLVPQLAEVSARGAISIEYQGDLTQYCRSLMRRDLTPRDMKLDVPNSIEGLLRLLHDIEAETEELIDTFSAGSYG